MTDRLSDVRHHINTVEQLGAVVNAMRGMAAARAAQARALMPAVRAYRSMTSRAFAAALPMAGDGEAPDGGGKAGDSRLLIVFGPEQGFCGTLADRVLEAAAPQWGGAGALREVLPEVLVIGRRLESLAGDRRLPVAQGFSLPTRPAGLPGLAIALGDAVSAWLENARRPEISMILPRWSEGRRVVIAQETLLPLDEAAIAEAPRSEPPLIHLPPLLLLEELAGEHLFAKLCEAAAESFAAENESRVTTMAAAGSAIERKLAGLRSAERLTRQEEITAEVVELAAGTRARHRGKASQVETVAPDRGLGASAGGN